MIMMIKHCSVMCPCFEWIMYEKTGVKIQVPDNISAIHDVWLLHLSQSVPLAFAASTWVVSSFSIFQCLKPSSAHFPSFLLTTLWPPVASAFGEQDNSTARQVKQKPQQICSGVWLMFDLCCKQGHYVPSFQHLSYFSRQKTKLVLDLAAFFRQLFVTHVCGV